MRIFVALSLLLCAVNGFRLSDLRPLERLLSPRSECIGLPSGTQLPHPVNCQQFILCENNSGLTLTCRQSHPHFDRCNGRCVDDITVCFVTSCNGAPTPPPVDPPTTTPGVPTAPPDTTPPNGSPTDIPTAPGETTTPDVPTAPGETTPETTTTTVFQVPTVPS